MSTSPKKNPLYVVTNDGKDVLKAEGFFDAMVKKFGLEPILHILNSLVDLLSDQVGNYGFFLFLQEFIDNIVESMTEIKNKVQSFVPIF